MGTLVVKVTSAVVLFAVTLMGCLLPFCLFRRHLKASGSKAELEMPVTVGLLLAAAGGVFVGTSLLHLLPECLETVANAMPETQYPVGEVTVAFGFLSLFVLEHLVLACQERSDNSADKTEAPKQHFKESMDQSVRYVKRTNGDVHSHSVVVTTESTYIRYGAVDESIDVAERSVDEDDEDEDEDALLAIDRDNSYREPLLPSHGNQVAFFKPTARKRAVVASTDPADGERQERPAEKEKAVTRNERVLGLRSFMLFLALSLHTVFDGLVVGLQDSEALVWTLLVAMSVHKALVAFSLGLNHLQSHACHIRTAMAYLVVFSLVTPAGVGLGTLLTEVKFNERARDYVSGFLQCFASGTFLYVTVFEGLKMESKGNRRILHVLLVLLGFGLVAVLRFFINDD